MQYLKSLMSMRLLGFCIIILCSFFYCFTAKAQATPEKQTHSGEGQLTIISSQDVTEALSLITEDPEKAEEALKRDDSATALCYRAYLRESGMIEPKGKDDSADALLTLAQSKLPPDLYASATEKTEWSGASETLSRILTTLFILHVNNINTQAIG